MSEVELEGLLGDDFRDPRASRRRSLTLLVVAARAVSPRKTALAGIEEHFRPAVVKAIGKCLRGGTARR